MAGMLRNRRAMAALAVLALAVGSHLTLGAGEARLGHHVVGGDRGWDVASDVAGWSTDKEFRVGESICESSFPLPR